MSENALGLGVGGGSRFVSVVASLIQHVGKSAGYVGVGILEVAIGAALAYKHLDLTGFAAVLSAVNIPLYGGGALKSWSDSRNGGGS